MRRVSTAPQQSGATRLVDDECIRTPRRADDVSVRDPLIFEFTVVEEWNLGLGRDLNNSRQRAGNGCEGL